MISKEEKNKIVIYKPKSLNNNSITSFYTTRIGGNTPAPLNSFSMGTAGDKNFEEHVERNKKVLCKTFGLDYQNIIMPEQKHTSNIKIVNNPSDDVTNCDGLITQKKGLVLMLLFADCVPIIFYSENKKTIGVIHAGWRGTAKKIAQNAVNILTEKFMVNPQELKVSIGPAIGQCCYPVSEEVAEELKSTLKKPINNHFIESEKTVKVDLKKINYSQLKELGVKNIDIVDDCTCCNNSVFYSYRKENGKTGRHAAVACIRG